MQGVEVDRKNATRKNEPFPTGSGMITLADLRKYPTTVQGPFGFVGGRLSRTTMSAVSAVGGLVVMLSHPKKACPSPGTIRAFDGAPMPSHEGRPSIAKLDAAKLCPAHREPNSTDNAAFFVRVAVDDPEPLHAPRMRSDERARAIRRRDISQR